MKKLVFVALAALLALLTTGPAGAEDDARIHLIHGIPGVDVDVTVDDEVVVPGFSYQDTQDLSDFAGQTLANLQVKVAGTDDVAIDVGDFDVPAEGNYTVIAHLDAEGTPTVSVYENDESTLDAGEGRLAVRHTAAAPAVDVLAGGEAVFSGIENGGEAAADLPAGTVTASVVPAGATEPVVIGPADLPVEEGSALIVYAVGSLDDENLEVLTETIDGLDGAPHSVPTGNSPIESSTPWLLVGAATMAGILSLAVIRPRLARQQA